jgi:hypothetical protein
VNGRINDPRTAPNIPVHVLIEHRSDETGASEYLPPELKHFVNSSAITVTSWNRDTDEIHEWTFKDPVLFELRKRPVDAEDAEWLRNIRARP